MVATVGRNKYGVAVGQVWKDNDPRRGDRHLRVLSVEEDDYPGGSADCELVAPKKGAPAVVSVRLDRFNGTSRGFSLVSNREEDET